MEKKSTTADMPTMVSSLAKARNEGYTVDFNVNEKGLVVTGSNRTYQPDEIHIDDFQRFEGASDPGDMVILYFLRTNDGVKGTISDAFGTYADSTTSEFMKKVEDIAKQTN